MKRIISLFLLLATLLMALAACAEGDASQQNTDTTAAEESTEPVQRSLFFLTKSRENGIICS